MASPKPHCGELPFNIFCIFGKMRIKIIGPSGVRALPQGAQAECIGPSGVRALPLGMHRQNILVQAECVRCPWPCIGKTQWPQYLALLAHAGYVRYHGTKCSLLTAFFSFSPRLLLISQKELLQASKVLHCVLSHKKKKWGKTKFWGPLLTQGVDFLGGFSWKN